jgi:hypothetical protein
MLKKMESTMKYLITASFLAFSTSLLGCPLLSVSGYKLHSSTSFSKIAGDRIWKSLDDTGEMPKVVLLNKSKTEKATFIFHPGSIKNNFSEVRIEKATPSDTGFVVEESSFKSGRIKLGMKIGEINNQFHYLNTTVEMGKKKIVVYQDIRTQRGCLKKVGMPLYYAHLYFNKSDRLEKIAFGYPYP